VDLKAAMIIAAGLAIGAWFGARAAQHVNGTTLQRSFAIFLVLIAARMWMKAGS
ncbi:MAG: TSUP family transporter, partial [Gemmatimonadetes bacterium]|nr:TSUP family transporter [Gemmatimonadota bacterium]